MKLKKIVKVGILIAVIGLSSACENKPQQSSNSGVSEVKWYIPTVMEGKDKKEVLDKVNQMMSDKYGVKLNMVMIDAGNYSQKLQVINAGREKYDLAFTCNWTNDYYTNVANNALMDITELLPKYAPKTYEATDKNVWDATKVNGKIYAVPNWQIQAKSACVNIRKEYLDKTGFSIDDINTLDSIEAYLTKLHEVKPDCNILGNMWNYYKYFYGMEPIVSENLPTAIYFDKDGAPKIFNQYETDEYRQYAEKMYSWVQKGLVTDKYDPQIDAGKLGRSPLGVFLYKPGTAEDYSRQYGAEVVSKPISKGVLAGSGILATMTGVSSTCDQPEKALRVIEIMNTDKDIYRTLCWGIEGRHYEKTSENQIKLVENSGYDRISDWMLGSVMNSFVMSDQAPDLYEQTKKWNDEAVVSPLIKVHFDTNPISTELANCQTVLKEQEQMINRGLVDDPAAAIDKMNIDLKKAGLDRVIEVLQAQVNEQLK